MRYTAKHIGETVQRTRKAMGVTQKDLALTSGTGLRFIIELEKGKPTCQLGKVLAVINTLGIDITLKPPVPGKATHNQYGSKAMPRKLDVYVHRHLAGKLVQD